LVLKVFLFMLFPQQEKSHSDYFSRTCNINSENIFIWKDFTYNMLYNVFCLKQWKFFFENKNPSLSMSKTKKEYFRHLQCCFYFYLTCADYASNVWQGWGCVCMCHVTCGFFNIDIWVTKCLCPFRFTVLYWRYRGGILIFSKNTLRGSKVIMKDGGGVTLVLSQAFFLLAGRVNFWLCFLISMWLLWNSQ